jgi:DNA-directed RNA polymerase specialized sigma24 family protein
MDEAALVLDLPAGTVKSRLHRARARLAEALRTETEAAP